ncbi:MAG TPA: DUF2089 domain-containing protein [Anaerolineales bacterium]|nr:DUF2089 domain-containing protein [Anaerolineales bacterium]
MYAALNRCPVCKSELTVTRLQCPTCDTVVEGRFTSGHFSNLSPEQIEFIVTFVRCEGKINRMEQEIGLSYPTIRNRLHEVIRALGFEPGKDDTPEVTEEKRRSILDDLNGGKITADEAMRLLRGEEE